MMIFRMLLLASFFGSSAFAVTAGSKVGAESGLSVSGGIALPSFATSVFQNGAGMTETGGVAVMIHGGSSQSFSNPRASVGLQYGNGVVGLGAGVTAIPNGGTTSTQAFYGLAVGVASGVANFGITGTTGLSDGTGTTLNLGIILKLANTFRLGFTGRNITGGISEFGAGLGYTINSWATIIVDASVDQAFQSLRAQPGILIGNETAALTVSYGFGSGSVLQLSDGFAAGGSLQLKMISWQVYYNQLQNLYTTVSFRF